MFILIDIPDAVINERIKYRVICPVCKTPRNTKLFVTKNVGYDKKSGQFYLLCDNPACKEARMVSKEGDNLGIEPIKQRLAQEEKIMEKVYSLVEVPKILLRNSVPVNQADKYFDSYEITPAYSFELEDGQVRVKEAPWIIKDNAGISSYSLLPCPVVIALIKQMAKILA
jgi:hypothetical protein